jgi:tetratricopeptide (TPR) repeat protein
MRLSLLAGLLGLLLAAPPDALAQGPRHFREAHEASQRRDLETAIQAYTLAIDSGDLPHPDLFFAYNNRGNAYAARRDWAHALDDYSAALRLNPKFAGAMRNRGTAYARMGDFERAIQDYGEAARLDPDDPHALIGRGLVYCERREFERATGDFDAALRICPTCPRALSGREAAHAGHSCF